ncbi:MAG: hypothetical protein AAB497_02485 [Patescibacteria group bacterium]
MQEIKSETKITIECSKCKERTEHGEIHIDANFFYGYKIFYECKKCNNRIKPSLAKYHGFLLTIETTAVETTIVCPKCKKRTEHERRRMSYGTYTIGYATRGVEKFHVYYRCIKCKNDIWEKDSENYIHLKSLLKREVLTKKEITTTRDDEIETCSSGADDHWP